MIAQIARPAPRLANTLPFVCIAMVMMVGMIAFAIDTAYVAVTRTQLQRSADAGALAGVQMLAPITGQTVPEASTRAEVTRFVTLNESLTVRTEDVKLFRYDPTKAAGSRMSYTYSANSPPNGVEVTLRRDAQANGSLNLFFAPALGQKTADVRARASTYIMPARSVLPGAPLIPYTMHVDYFYAALGLPRTGLDGKTIQTFDNWRLNANGTVSSGSDGVKEVVLFGSTKNTPGNFGSIDLGSDSNGTPELERQILHGPTWADFHHRDFVDKLQTDGSLLPPVVVGGDPGISAGVKDAFAAIVGQPRIIPLYNTVTGQGNNTRYNIVAFAAVVITDSDFQGNPKSVRVQPTKIITNKVLPAPLDTGLSVGVYTQPRLAMPEN